MGKMKTFNVTGVTFRNNPTDTMRRIDMISKYCGHGSKFELQREPENSHSNYAIAVRQVFKSGGSILLGYVPDNKKNPLAKELALLMDDGWKPAVEFGRKFIDEDTGECKGLQLRYENQNG